MIDEILLICFFVLVIGACIGSFLNVVALRAISKESIVLPPSKCPECGEPIKWYDNIPVLSYLFTFKGKCRNCGCKVSKQYPIVEALTAVIFLAVFLAFGASIKTILLLILLCISIVICITDFKKEYVFDSHSWALIIFSIIASLYFNGLENYSKPAIGLIVGVVTMEAVARLAYYLIRKKSQEKTADTENNEEVKEEVQTETPSEESTEVANQDEDININEYVEKNKRAFGEGDTYLAAAAGALLGWKYLLAAIGLAIILQAVCILPQFLMNLYKQKQFRLLFSLTAFIVLACIYWIISNIVSVNIFVAFGFVIALIFFAIDSITRLKQTVNDQGFAAIPFGPALLCATFLLFFYGPYIIGFLKKHIFMILG